VIIAAFLMQALTTTQLDRVVDTGIERGVFPGAVVVIGTRDSILYARGFGRLTWSADGPVPDPAATLYDLASLTKVVATTPAIMLLVERGSVKLDQRVSAYLPDFVGTGKDAITVRHLLAHSSGLRAYLRLDTLARDAAGARRLVMQEPLRWNTGTHVEYSDLNAMLLGWIIERVSSISLDDFVSREIFTPLGLQEMRFRPPRALWSRVAPTGRWRGHSIAGTVNDQNAARLGGASGHAGAFSTGLDLARYAQFWLGNGATQTGKRIFRPETMTLFQTRQAGTRALGWELRDSTTTDNWGRKMGPRTFGHTGFTGTSIWIDPDRGLFAVILTNRVYAPRNARSITRLKEIRGQVADAAVTLKEESR
jgi:CubicO group peptidase (beta-lactamase class C family)